MAGMEGARPHPPALIAHRRGPRHPPRHRRDGGHLRQLLFRQAPFQEWGKLRERRTRRPHRRRILQQRGRGRRDGPHAGPRHPRRARHGAHARHPDPARDHPRRTAHGGQSRHRLFDLPVPDSRQPFDHPHRHHHRARLREAHQVPHSNPARHHRRLLPARRVPAPQQHVRRVDGPAHRRDRLPDALCGFPRGPVPHRLRAQRAA